MKDIDKRLREMKPKDTPLLVMGYFLLGMMLLLSTTAKADDQEILIEQAGDNVIIEANQEGYDNKVEIELGLVSSDSSNNIFRALQDGFDNEINFSLDGQSNELAILQEGNNQYIGYSTYWGAGHDQGGDIDGDSNTLLLWQKCNYTSCNENKIEFHIEGDNNDVEVAQGWFLDKNSNNGNTTWSYDSNEPGGNFLRLDIHGDNNEFKSGQKMDSASVNHNMYVNIFGDGNEVYAGQLQNGSKTLNLNIYNDNNDVYIKQRKNGAHTATINLYGSYGTDLYLNQAHNSIGQTYTLTQTCATLGGCSVSVTQD
tara:strand:+ start:187 stop:1122 length:936 start_codon:yes stop_codon:yes gene_type:complete